MILPASSHLKMPKQHFSSAGVRGIPPAASTDGVFIGSDVDVDAMAVGSEGSESCGGSSGGEAATGIE